MILIRSSARLSALLVTAALVASCDTRLPTQPGGKVVDDLARPELKFTLSAGTNNTVEQGTPLTVTITATDAQGIAALQTSMRNGAQVVASDTAVVATGAKTVTRTLPVPLAGLARGDKLTIRATATDVSQNTKVDSIVVTVSDTTAPTVTVSSSRSGRTLRGGDTLDLKVVAADSAGIAYAGYRLVRVNGSDTTIVRVDSAFVPSGTRPTIFSPSFAPVLPATLLTGGYSVIGFALDRSGLTNRTSTVASFILADGQRPALVFQAPAAGGRVQVGDSILVRARITDNVALARVSFRAVSIRGAATLGTADTVVRYAAITAPSATGSFVAGTRDTVISRYLKVTTPIDTLTDSLVVFGIVTDASNNADTARVAVSLVPRLSLTTDRPGAVVKTGEAILVRVVAGDTAAVFFAGYRVFRVNAADSTLVRSDSVAAPTGATTFRPAAFNYVVADTLSPATYTFSAFARTSLGLITRPATGFGFSVSDGQKPAVTLTAPLTGSSLRAGDSILVTAVLRDNAALQGVTFRGFSVRGRATLGTADTVARYTTITAPATGAFRTSLRDTTLSRYLKVISPIDTASDSLVVLAVVTDRSGLADTTRAALKVTNTLRPRIVLNTPVVGSTVNVGDSILVTATLHDDNSLASAAFFGVSARGNPSLGTADTVTRYPRVSTTFRTGLRDTTITRYLKAAVPIDTTTDSLIVTGVVANALGFGDTSRVTVKLSRGPTIAIITPLVGDSASAGVNLRVRLTASHATGVIRLGFRIRGDASWPTALNDSAVRTFAPPASPGTLDSVFFIPANAPAGSVVTISPFAVSGDGQLSTAAPLRVPVRSGAAAPRVVQSISARSETTDSLTVSASGNGIATIGYELRDAANAIVKVDTVRFAAPLSSSQIVTFGFTLPITLQGKKLALTSFAIDQAGLVGYSVSAATTSAQTSRAGAFVDSTLIVFGRTFALPAARRGTIADLTVDQARGNVFLSNLNFNQLEVFQGTSTSFSASGIPVGAQPWGMTVARTGVRDTLYVANSGGTNVSRVFIGATTAAGMREDSLRRIRTRVSFLYRVTEVRNAETGKIRITVSAPISFSDRPQFVEQSSGNRLYVSTRPTLAAPRGTVRFLDPSAPAPDFRFILDFASTGNDPNSYLIANVDSMGVAPAPAASTDNDVLTICDHASGQLTPSACGSSNLGIAAAIAALRVAVPTTDIDTRINADEASLGLTDTTFAASSGNGNAIGFGEGVRAPFARAFILRDSLPGATRYQYASPAISVGDLVNNAADRLFGLAIDSTGKTLGVHGGETYFATLDVPFTQRLQGKVSTFSSGAGIAFHPQANGDGSAADKRLAFVSSANGTIEALDIFHYTTRARLATKANLYGPLRASLPFATDNVGVAPGTPSFIVLKLFGLSATGLVVINVTAADIAAPPP